MNRHDLEVEYWDKATQDPEVHDKYICNLSTEECLKAIGKPEGVVLDLGCGIGRLMKSGYYGTDISSEMLKLAEKAHPDCFFRKTDGKTIDFPNETFDFVYTMLMFQHIPTESVLNYIREVSRILKHRGKFVFQYIVGKQSEPFSHFHDDNLINKCLLENGFSYFDSKGAVHPYWTWVRAIKNDS